MFFCSGSYMNSTCNVLFRECMNYMVVWFFTLCSWTANPIHMDGKDLCRSLQHRQDSHPTIEIFGPMPLLTLSGCLWDRPNERINWRLRAPMGISPKAELVRVGTGARARPCQDSEEDGTFIFGGGHLLVHVQFSACSSGLSS